jgi:hypothetical protein
MTPRRPVSYHLPVMRSTYPLPSDSWATLSATVTVSLFSTVCHRERRAISMTRTLTCLSLMLFDAACARHTFCQFGLACLLSEHLSRCPGPKLMQRVNGSLWEVLR